MISGMKSPDTRSLRSAVEVHRRPATERLMRPGTVVTPGAEGTHLLTLSSRYQRGRAWFVASGPSALDSRSGCGEP